LIRKITICGIRAKKARIYPDIVENRVDPRAGKRYEPGI
jgi:hypothetical protein